MLVKPGLDQSSDLGQVEEVTCDVAREVMRGRTFADQSAIGHEFIKRLHNRYQREGTSIPFPAPAVISGARPGTTGR